MHLSRKKLFIGLLIGLLTLTTAVGGVAAADPTDAAFARIRFVYDLVRTYHKDGADLDKFTAGAIKGGLEALGDPYTNYYTPGQFNDFLSTLNGSFSGIGAYLDQENNYVIVTSPIKGTPAAKAGLKTGDRILEVDGTSLVGATTDTATKLIRGVAGTDVTLKIERPSEGRTFTVTIKREQINIPEVESKMLDKEIGYIQISTFGDDAANDFYKAVDSLKQQGAKAIVLDLRQNGGGYLDAAVEIASAFVPKDQPVVWEVTKTGKTSLNSKGRLINLPTTVLVDNGSASASEILSGAIQDYGAAPLVGIKTFGKGTVQQILPISDGSGMKITIAEYLTAKERHVNKISLTPDYVVENPKPSLDRTAPMDAHEAILPGTGSLQTLYLQYRLQDLGYDPDTNGYFGMKTLNAVERFAFENRVEGDPLVNSKFIQVLNDKVTAHAKEATPVDLQLNKAVDLLKAKLAK